MSQSSSPAQTKAAKGQPKGLWVLFITEMWERFSYYGMRALLVFYLVSKISADNPGFGWSDKTAQMLLAVFAGSVYFTPLFGGWLADKFLGTHRSMLIGGWIMAIGQGLLFFTEYWGYSHGVETVTLSTAAAPFLTFMLGLILIILGTGLFKPCVSVMVGQLYGSDDPRRDSGFTIFYMGINVGALMSTLVAGTIGETYGWHWGFGAAAVGMILGLTAYQIVRPFYLKGIGLPPHHVAEHEEGHQPTPEEIKQAEQDEYERTRPLTRVDWDRMIVIVVLALFGIVFWVAFEQAASSLNLFALNRTDRNVLGFEFPATWYQSINPAAIVFLAPLFSALWVWLDKRKLQPSTPVKFGLGLSLLSLAYLPMLFASIQAGNPKPIQLANVPEAVQSVLNPINEELIQEREENEAKEKAKREKEDKEGLSYWKQKVRDIGDYFAGGGGKDKNSKDHEFDVLEELANNDVKYYAVGYGDKKENVYALYDTQGKLLRRNASRKDDEDAPKVEKVKDAKPEEIKLEDVPEAVRETILAQVDKGKTVESLHGKLIAKQPIVKVWKDEKKHEFETTHKRRIRNFTATWNDDQGEVKIKVDEGGLLLAKDSEAIHEVGLAGPQWLMLMYLLATCGELCLSPISLSMVTKLSPARYTSLMMGLFFVSFAAANFIAHTLAAYSSDIATGRWFTILGGQIDFFLVLTIAPAIIAAIVFLISPAIKRMMHGLN